MALKLEKVKEERKKNKLVFRMKGSDEVFANTVRRLILEEVPTLAVEDVEFTENSSALYDEMFALRLGLTPIKTDYKGYVQKSKCKCEGAGCAQCELKLSLKVSKKGYVYAEDAQSSDPKCTFVYPKMPLVKLLSKQKVDIVMIATLGTGREHTKWTPGWAHYKKEPVLKVGAVKNPEEIVKNCPDGVLTLKGKKIEVDEEKVLESNLVSYYAELDDAITLEYGPNVIFTLESWGHLSCKEILVKSAQILQEKVEEMSKLI